ncbi:MAG: hypothetical protein WD768_05020 [Phycisphaeraceae bacterium]
MQLSRLHAAAQSNFALTRNSPLKSAVQSPARASAMTDGAVVPPVPTNPGLPGTPTAIVTIEYLVLGTFLALALIVGVTE